MKIIGMVALLLILGFFVLLTIAIYEAYKELNEDLKKESVKHVRTKARVAYVLITILTVIEFYICVWIYSIASTLME